MIEGLNFIVRKVGVKNLIFITVMALLISTLLLDVYLVEKIFDPLTYLYITLGTIFVVYAVPPLYASRRLLRYYWDRTKKNRLAVGGLAFILFLILIALIGTLFISVPTAVHF